MRNIFTIAAIALFIFLISGCKKNEDNSCNGVVCQNGAECVNNACQCPEGYEDTDCGTESRTKFFGSFNTVTNCDVTAYTVTIATSNLGKNYVSLNNLLDDQTLPVFGIVQSGNSITISQQTVGNYIVSGNLTFTSDVVSANIVYNETVNNISTSCFGTMTRLQ